MDLQQLKERGVLVLSFAAESCFQSAEKALTAPELANRMIQELCVHDLITQCVQQRLRVLCCHDGADLTPDNWRAQLERVDHIENRIYLGVAFEDRPGLRGPPGERCSIFDCSTGFQLELLHITLGELKISRIRQKDLEAMRCWRVADIALQERMLARGKVAQTGAKLPSLRDRLKRLEGASVLLVCREVKCLQEVFALHDIASEQPPDADFLRDIVLYQDVEDLPPMKAPWQLNKQANVGRSGAKSVERSVSPKADGTGGSAARVGEDDSDLELISQSATDADDEDHFLTRVGVKKSLPGSRQGSREPPIVKSPKRGKLGRIASRSSLRSGASSGLGSVSSGSGVVMSTSGQAVVARKPPSTGPQVKFSGEIIAGRNSMFSLPYLSFSQRVRKYYNCAALVHYFSFTRSVVAMIFAGPLLFGIFFLAVELYLFGHWGGGPHGNYKLPNMNSKWTNEERAYAVYIALLTVSFHAWALALILRVRRHIASVDESDAQYQHLDMSKA